MSPTLRARAAALPVLAALSIGGVLGVQLTHGGGRFTPIRPANPCDVRTVSSVSTGLDGLTEKLVLLGLDRTACLLGTTREALILQLASPGVHSDRQINALRSGLLQAVGRMNAEGTLPTASVFVDDALDQSSLNPLIKTAIRALPAAVINKALNTDDVLVRTVNDLDLRTLLNNLNDPNDLTAQITAAITKAAEQSLAARLGDLL